MNDLHRICDVIGLPHPAEDAAWAAGWDQSAACFDPSSLQHLQPATVAATTRTLAMTDATRRLLVDGLDAFASSLELQRLLFHLCRRLYRCDLPYEERCRIAGSCPVPPAHVHPLAPLLQAYVTLEGAPDALAAARSRGWDDAIVRHTWSDLELWIHRLRQRTGHYGFAQLPWMMNHLAGRIIRFGRLQFNPGRVPAHVRGFRHRTTRRVVIVSEPGFRYRTDGQHDGVNGITDPHAWTSVCERRDGALHAHLISPQGRAVPQLITLPDDQWEPIIAPGAPTMSIHIPADGPMDFDACGSSLHMAAELFPRYLPEHAARIFSCNSWLCDPQFSDLLPPASNIRRFQSQFYLLPLPGASERSLFIQLFGREFENLDDIPQDNSLFRTIVEHKRRGGRWQRAGALLHVDDLHWAGPGYRDNPDLPRRESSR